MTKLRLAPDLALPFEAITETLAVLGIRGSGKTNTAAVYAEELLGAGQQVVVLDPTDAWWGLKSSADGQKPGHPVVVLGGKHQDLPLASTDGKLIAEFVVEQRASVVCSLRGFESKQQEMRFATDFLRRLYYLKGQQDAPTPLALMIDEASRLVPQRVMGEDAACVGAVQQIVRQGRSSGFGVVLIDQRAATVNKDVLAQLEMLVVHRTTSPQDRKALKEWIDAHDTADRGAEFLGSLASLDVGQAWVWSPGWLDLFKKVQVRARRTFDSSRTPRAGELVVTPKRIAEVDLEQLRGKLAATLEKAKLDDPKALRARIAELERAAGKPPVGWVSHETMVSQINASTAEAGRQFRRLAEQVRQEIELTLTRLRVIGQSLEPLAVWLGDDIAGAVLSGRVSISDALKSGAVSAPRWTTEDSRAEVQVGNREQGTGANHPSVSAVGRSSRAPARPIAPSGDTSLGKGERTVLTAIAQYPDDGVDREQLSVLTGYKRSSRDTYIQRLQAAGLIEVAGSVILATDAGFDALGPGFETLPTGAALRAYWLNRLSGGERAILEVVVAAYPRAITRDVISERTEYKRSSRDTYLQRLSARKLVESVGRSEVRASSTLFEGR